MLIFEIFIAGKYEATADTINEIIKITKIELKFISLAILLKNRYLMEKYLN